MSDDEPAAAPLRRPRRRRWGLWALAFLTVALVAVLTAGGGWTTRGALALLGGLLGAAYCSYRGVKEFTWLPR
jgi:4-hydroxybenzoate polyprenyltransferase